MEILVKYVLHLDLTLDSFGFLAVNGVTVKLNSGVTIVCTVLRISTQAKTVFTASAWTISIYFLLLCDKRVVVMDQSLEPPTPL